MPFESFEEAFKARQEELRKQDEQAREEEAKARRVQARRAQAIRAELPVVKKLVDDAIKFAVAKGEIVWRNRRTSIWPETYDRPHGNYNTVKATRWVHREHEGYYTDEGKPFSFSYSYPDGSSHLHIALDSTAWRIGMSYRWDASAPYGKVPEKIDGNIGEDSFPLPELCEGFMKEFAYMVLK